MRRESSLGFWLSWVLVAWLLPAAAGAATLYGGTEPGDHATIQGAVAAAGTGDTVVI